MLTDRREVREPRVPVAAPIVPVLESTQGWGRREAAVSGGLWGSGDSPDTGGHAGRWQLLAQVKRREPPCSLAGQPSPFKTLSVRNQPHSQRRDYKPVLTALLITTTTR